MVVEDISVVKKPLGQCAVCGEQYGELILEKTGETVGEFNDCSCHDDEIAEELNQEKITVGPAFVV